MWKDFRKSDLHIAICKLHSKRKLTETPCQRRIQQFLGNKCSLGWSPGLKRQQTPCRSSFACWLFEPESNMSLLSVLGRIALWLLLWWPSRALVCAHACTRAWVHASSFLSLCTGSSASRQHLECVPSSLCSWSGGWQDGEQRAAPQPSASFVCRVLLCSAPLSSVEPQIRTASTVRLKREGAKEELHAHQQRETDGFLSLDPIGRNTPSQFSNRFSSLLVLFLHL